MNRECLGLASSRASRRIPPRKVISSNQRRIVLRSGESERGLKRRWSTRLIRTTIEKLLVKIERERGREREIFRASPSGWPPSKRARLCAGGLVASFDEKYVWSFGRGGNSLGRLFRPDDEPTEHPQQVVFKFLEFNKPTRNVKRSDSLPLFSSTPVFPSPWIFGKSHTRVSNSLDAEDLKPRSDLEKIVFVESFGEKCYRIVGFYYVYNFVSSLVSSAKRIYLWFIVHHIRFMIAVRHKKGKKE